MMTKYVAALNRKYHRIKPTPRRDLEQYSVDLNGVFLRSREIFTFGRTGSCLLVGDDDLLSLFLADSELKLTLLEKDERTIAAIRENEPTPGRIKILPSDFRDVYNGKWPQLDHKFDMFAASPPYTREGLKIWTAIGLRNLEVGGFGFIAAPYDDSERANLVTVEVQRFVLANGCIIEKVIPGLTIEEGLPAYQIVVRKLHDVKEIDWLSPLKNELYEWEEFKEQDAFAHQVDHGENKP
jgi:predicted methyltransferase